MLADAKRNSTLTRLRYRIIIESMIELLDGHLSVAGSLTARTYARSVRVGHKPGTQKFITNNRFRGERLVLSRQRPVGERPPSPMPVVSGPATLGAVMVHEIKFTRMTTSRPLS